MAKLALLTLLTCVAAASASSVELAPPLGARELVESCSSCSCHGKAWRPDGDADGCIRKRTCCSSDHGGSQCSCGCLGSGWQQRDGKCTKRTCSGGYCSTDTKDCCGSSHDGGGDDGDDDECGCSCYGSSWYEDDGYCYRKRQVREGGGGEE
jgi:hypothetical protein